MENIIKDLKEQFLSKKYRSEITTKIKKNNNLNCLINLTFRNIDCLFVVSFKNGDDDPKRNCFNDYYMLLVKK